MTVNLNGRLALVTGASRGIGYFTALALARAGAHVIASARTVGGLEELDDAIQAAQDPSLARAQQLLKRIRHGFHLPQGVSCRASRARHTGSCYRAVTCRSSGRSGA